MYVQLKRAFDVEVNGVPRRLQPGDWLNVGRQEALRMLNEGIAVCPSGAGKLLDVGAAKGRAGCLIWGGDVGQAKKVLGDDLARALEFVEADFPAATWEKTLALRGSGLALRSGFVPVGFDLLDTWEVAVPMRDYSVLATQAGDEKQRTAAQAVLNDLRVPLYESGALFLRRCTNTVRLLERWKARRESLGDDLGFLVALYEVKPFVLALPCTWMGDMRWERE